MDIENLGEAVVDQLVERGLARSICDLYLLTFEQAMQLDGFAEKSAENLIAALADSKKREFWRVLCGLGIKHVGSSASKDLASRFGSLSALMEATVEDLSSVDGVGSIMAQSIRDFFSDDETLEMINQLMRLGVRCEQAGANFGLFAFGGKNFRVDGNPGVDESGSGHS